ncbi:MAG: SDR family NAD(P)-dependent oxidoreductase, partial [Pseudomonadota bacterium]|nr:SDR family NAD(P)-dependent oxidoreductase [Pseudomonadota bacterium]
MSTRGLTVDLNDKTALVTGASSGIGAAVAEALAASGAFVWVNHPADSTVDAAEAVVTAITEAGGKAQPVQADVSEEADVLAMFSQVGSGPLDILVN